MESGGASADAKWWVVAVPAVLGADKLCDGWVLLSLLAAFLMAGLVAWACTPGGGAWAGGRARRGSRAIPGPRGLPVLGSLLTLSSGLPHRALAAAARAIPGAGQLMAFSIGATPAVVTADPGVARELLAHPHLADRPLKRSARELMFGRAMGFAPSGAYWRLLRRVAASHLFAPRRIAAHEPARQADCAALLGSVLAEQRLDGRVRLRRHLQMAALNGIMGSVFGRRYEDWSDGNREAAEIKAMVREGFELLGSFNWSDHLPWLGSWFDPDRVSPRCAELVAKVRTLVRAIIADHRARRDLAEPDAADFVDVLLSLDGDDKLDEDDMVAVLWEMIFRGTDTTALLTEWAMAELVLHPEVQSRLRAELDGAVGPDGQLTDADVACLPYLQSVVKETLRAHPPGPLLSWARLATSDVLLGNGMVVPTGTTAMVNMWAITHDPSIWARPEEFSPERFSPAHGGADVDVRGSDLRLAPFGAGRRVCPGKNLGLVTVGLWVGRLVHRFEWRPAPGEPVDLAEQLKLSLEMKNPLAAVALPRAPVAAT
ncbi:cytochrome P450, family 78, subfamily A, polypeptide 7 [Wolffia australiana]